MRIATWNINGLRARLSFLLLWLKERKPDLVGIQEIKIEDKNFFYEVLETAGYYALVHGQKAWNGVAILSREPLQLVQKGLPGEDEMGARLISASLGELNFTTIYCPNGKQVTHADFQRKLKWLDSLIHYLRKEQNPSQSAIVCGDFNICPSPFDTWNEELFNGEIFHTQEERMRFQHLLDYGLFDIYRELQPDDHSFSWWDYRGGAFHKNEGLRIDFLLSTSPIFKKTQRVIIDREYRKKRANLTPSDHVPVWIDLDD